MQPLTSRPCHRSAYRCATTDQLTRLAAVRNILHGRRNKRTKDTLTLLTEAGYEPRWLRVRWTGGVGSYVIMRGNVVRILVSSTKSGLTDPKFRTTHPVPGMSFVVSLPSQRRGYRYGWCVELPP